MDPRDIARLMKTGIATSAVEIGDSTSIERDATCTFPCINGVHVKPLYLSFGGSTDMTLVEPNAYLLVTCLNPSWP